MSSSCAPIERCRLRAGLGRELDSCGFAPVISVCDLQPDLAVRAERDRVDPKSRALAVQSLPGAQVIGALVQRTDHGRATGQAIGERPARMRTLGLGGEDLAGLGAKQCDAPAGHRECAAFALGYLRDLADQDAVRHVTLLPPGSV